MLVIPKTGLIGLDYWIVVFSARVQHLGCKPAHWPRLFFSRLYRAQGAALSAQKDIQPTTESLLLYLLDYNS